MTRSVSFFIAAVLLAGCASVPREAGFGDVRSTVAERTGGMRIHWNQGSAADDAVAAEVEQMTADGEELSMDEAVQIAVLNNKRLQMTYEDLMVAQADLVAAGLLRNPVFEAEVAFVEGGGGTGLELGVVQEFLSIFQIPLRKRIAGARFESAKLRVSAAVLDLAADVREAYYTLVASRQLLEMRRQSLEAAEAAYELARRIHEAGNITALTLDLERAQFEQAKLDVQAAEYEVLANRERLSVLMGLDGQSINQWQAPGRLPDPPADAATMPAEASAATMRQALDNNLELAALRQEVEQASRLLGLERTQGLLPDLELGVKGEREAEDGTWAVGPVLELPIPLFSQGQPQIAAAAAELRRTRAAYRATAVELESSVRTAHALLANAEARVRHYRETVLPLRARIVEQTQLEYNAMITGAFELLEARRRQIEAGGEFILALRDYWLAHSALEALRSGSMRRVSGDAGRGGSLPDRAGAQDRDDH